MNKTYYVASSYPERQSAGNSSKRRGNGRFGNGFKQISDGEFNILSLGG